MAEDDKSEPITLDYRKIAIWLWLLAAMMGYLAGLTSILFALNVAVAVHFTVKAWKFGVEPNAPPAAIRLPRFSITRLLIATTLIAIGAGMLGLIPVVLGTAPKPSQPWWTSYYLFGGPALTGAGFGTPFHRPLAGAMCGIILFVLIAFAWLF